MSSERPSLLHKNSRRGSRLEAALKQSLGAAAVTLAVLYGIGLVYLFVRGGAKITSFMLYPTPGADVDNEELMRFVTAVCMFGAIGWGVLSIVRSVMTRMKAWPARGNRYGRAAVVGVAILGAAVARDHLPRFLVSLP